MEFKERRRLHRRTLRGRFSPRFLGAALAGARGPEARFTKDVARLAYSRRVGGAPVRRRNAIAGLALALGLGACEREHQPEPPAPRVKQVFHLSAYEKDFGFSQAVLIDKTLYVSGSVAADQDGRLVAPGDMAGQMRAAYSNIQRTLAAHGADFEEVVKETIFTTNMDALLKASDLRFEYYNKERLPTTSWVQVQRLVDPGFLVEIEVVAELP